MKEYFLLHYKMANRSIREWGANPIVAYVLACFFFVIISIFTFQKSDFAQYLVVFMALNVLIKVAETKRTNFLRTVYGDEKSRAIRTLENLAIILPFSCLLICYKAYATTVLLLLVSIYMARFAFKLKLDYTLPTPFYKQPFEFIVGFRNTCFVFLLAYLLVFVAVIVNNINLGIFAMLLVFLVSLGYYAKPENEYYVWIYACSPAKFLRKKLITATQYSGLSALPILVALGVFYPEQIQRVLLLLLLGFAFLWSTILAKYAAYPNEISLPEGIMLAVCLYFPPFLLFLLPYFYYKSINQLNTLLK